MSLLNLVASSFFAGLGIGGTKFYLLGDLSSRVYSLDDKNWVIQLVGAIITIGPAVMFALAGPLAAACRKSSIMLCTGGLIGLVLSFGVFTFWLGSGWTYALLAGLMLGIFNPARNACVPLEAASGKRSAESVNAWINNLYVAGLLAGVPAGTSLYSLDPSLGAIPIIISFCLAAVLGWGCKYDVENNHLKDYRASFYELIQSSRLVLSKNFHFLSAAALFWGMAGALSLAVTAYAEQRHLAGPVMCSLMSAYAAIGVVMGNALAVPLSRWRYKVVIGSSITQIAAVLAIPLVVEFLPGIIGANPAYWLISVLVLLEGTLFGMATNLIEAEFFRRVFRMGHEGTGSALLSALIAIFSFLLSGFIAVAIIKGWIDSVSQFALLGLVNVLATLVVYRLSCMVKKELENA